METAEKLITAEKLENLTAQLKSSEEDKILTLNIINNYDVLENLIFFILLKKNSNTSWALWKEHAPKVTEVLLSSNVLGENPNLTYQFIITVGAKHKVNVNQLQYFMDAFGEHMLDVLKSYGYDFIKTIDITLTEKYQGSDNDVDI